jgi:hypothetical protein
MIGSKQRNCTPLIQVSLEGLVPPDHFYRHLERTLDLSDVARGAYTRPMLVEGVPPLTELVFFKLQLVMFFEGIVRCANRIS